MSEVNLTEAFGSYKVKPSARGRSAVTPVGTLVLSCWYSRFNKPQAGVLRYEEDLSSETGSVADMLRAHLAEALAREYDVQLIVAVEATAPTASDPFVAGSKAVSRVRRTTFHARKDLLGRITFYDGQRFVIEFRKRALPQ